MIQRLAYYYTQENWKDLDEFERAARMAKAAGATHMMVGQFGRSRWMWERDLTDPYCNWLMSHVPLFRLACPPALRPYLPADYTDDCLDMVIGAVRCSKRSACAARCFQTSRSGCRRKCLRRSRLARRAHGSSPARPASVLQPLRGPSAGVGM
jgi:hypothetical protein